MVGLNQLPIVRTGRKKWYQIVHEEILYFIPKAEADRACLVKAVSRFPITQLHDLAEACLQRRGHSSPHAYENWKDAVGEGGTFRNCVWGR